MQELFALHNGRVIMDERLSEKMYLIKQYHPEKADESSSGFEWSEMGMANLFGVLYSHEARYCPEHKSWYTYHEGAWRRDEEQSRAGLKYRVISREYAYGRLFIRCKIHIIWEELWERRAQEKGITSFSSQA